MPSGPKPILPHPFVLSGPKPILPRPFVLSVSKPILPHPFVLSGPKPILPHPFVLSVSKPILPRPFVLSLSKHVPEAHPPPLHIDRLGTNGWKKRACLLPRFAASPLSGRAEAHAAHASRTVNPA